MIRRVLFRIQSEIECEEEECQQIAHLLEYLLKMPIIFKFVWLYGKEEDEKNAMFRPHMLIDMSFADYIEKFERVIEKPFIIEILYEKGAIRGPQIDVTLVVVDDDVDMDKLNQRIAEEEKNSQTVLKSCVGIFEWNQIGCCRC